MSDTLVELVRAACHSVRVIESVEKEVMGEVVLVKGKIFCKCLLG